jgi:hypothetical protein
MTQGRDGISLAPTGARRLMGVARGPLIMAVALLCTAFIAGTTGTSYAKHTPKKFLLNTVVVSNFGSLFDGSVETFTAGSFVGAKPALFIRGGNTLIDAGNGAAGDAQSSVDGDIAVTIPLGIPGLCPSGAVAVWPSTANGNSSPEDLICGPAGSTPSPPPFPPALNNLTGLNLDQGDAFNNPNREVSNAVAEATGLISLPDQLAVSSVWVVVGSFDPTSTTPACEGMAPAPAPPTLGTIVEFVSGNTGNVAPTPNVPVIALNPTNLAAGPFIVNATIGGCDTALDFPVGVAFDGFGDLWVVNEGLAAAGQGPPGFVTEYAPGAFGDAMPINIVGLMGVTTETAPFVNPLYITTSFDGDTIYVTDIGDNSVKIFDTSIPFVDNETGVIHGGNTKLKRPEGIALSPQGNLYVVNNFNDTLNEYANVGTGGGNIRPTFMLPGTIGGNTSKMHLPVGVALPEFVGVPSGTPTIGATGRPN